MNIDTTDGLYDCLYAAHGFLMQHSEHDGIRHCQCDIAELLRLLSPEHDSTARMKRTAKKAQKVRSDERTDNRL